MSLLSTVVWYYNPNKCKNYISNPFITWYLQKWETIFQHWDFGNFKFLFIYERIQNQIRIFGIFILALSVIPAQILRYSQFIGTLLDEYSLI